MQTAFDFGPQVGQIWTEHAYIVMVTDVGGYGSMGKWMPNLIRFVNIGQIKPHGDGAYWYEDLRNTHGGTSFDDYLAKQAGQCDKLYLKPWSGCGIFFGSAEADKFEDLSASIRECRCTPKKPEKTQAMWDYMEKQEKMFTKRLAPHGFQ